MKYWYQRLQHRDLLANAALLHSGEDTLGVYLILRLLAGDSWDHGFIHLYNQKKRATLGAVSEWFTQILGKSEKYYQDLFMRLKKVGAIGVDKEDRLHIENWDEEQAKASNPEAEAKQNQRAPEHHKRAEKATRWFQKYENSMAALDGHSFKKMRAALTSHLSTNAQGVNKVLRELNVDGLLEWDEKKDSYVAYGILAASPLAPADSDEASAAGRRPHRNNQRSEKRRDTYVSQTSDSDRGSPSRGFPRKGTEPTDSGASGEAAFRNESAANNINIYEMDPIHAALKVCWDHDKGSGNTFTSYLNKFHCRYGDNSEAKFLECLHALQTDLRDGAPINSPVRIFVGKLKDALGE